MSYLLLLSLFESYLRHPKLAAHWVILECSVSTPEHINRVKINRGTCNR